MVILIIFLLFLQGKIAKCNILSYGINKYINTFTQKTIHAESNAIQKLPFNTKNKRYLKKINIFIIRTSNTGNIGMSKPCINCIHDICNLPQKKGYIIKNIYYSDSNGNIIHTNINKIITEGNFHTTKYHRTNC